MFRRLSFVSNVASTSVIKGGGVGGNSSSSACYIGNLLGNNGCVYGRGLFGAVAKLLVGQTKLLTTMNNNNNNSRALVNSRAFSISLLKKNVSSTSSTFYPSAVA